MRQIRQKRFTLYLASNILSLGVMRLVPLLLLLRLLTSCHQNSASAENNGLKFYTARVIDSLVAVIDSNVSAIQAADDTTFANFINSKEKKLIKNFRFKDSTEMIYHLQKEGLSTALRKYYFDKYQLLKVSFGSTTGFSSRSLGSYYYSKEKAFLLTTSNRRLPRPDEALVQAKQYLREIEQ